MATANVTMGVRMVNDRTAIIDIHGEINQYAESVLMDAYNQASANGAQAIVLDFNDLKYMNSSGIGLLVTLLIRVRRQNQRLLAFGLTDHYQQIFQLTRLNEAIGIFPDEAEAVKAAKS